MIKRKHEYEDECKQGNRNFLNIDNAKVEENVEHDTVNDDNDEKDSEHEEVSKKSEMNEDTKDEMDENIEHIYSEECVMYEAMEKNILQKNMRDIQLI